MSQSSAISHLEMFHPVTQYCNRTGQACPSFEDGTQIKRQSFFRKSPKFNHFLFPWEIHILIYGYRHKICITSVANWLKRHYILAGGRLSFLIYQLFFEEWKTINQAALIQYNLSGAFIFVIFHNFVSMVLGANQQASSIMYRWQWDTHGYFHSSICLVSTPDCPNTVFSKYCKFRLFRETYHVPNILSELQFDWLYESYS